MLSGGAYLNPNREKGCSTTLLFAQPLMVHAPNWLLQYEDTFYIYVMKSVNLLFILNCLGVRSYLSKGKRNDKYRSGKINTSVYQ